MERTFKRKISLSLSTVKEQEIGTPVDVGAFISLIFLRLKFRRKKKIQFADDSVIWKTKSKENIEKQIPLMEKQAALRDLKVIATQTKAAIFNDKNEITSNISVTNVTNRTYRRIIRSNFGHKQHYKRQDMSTT